MIRSPYIEAYLTCAFWSELDANDEPLEDNYTLEDLDPKSLKKMIDDCNQFEDKILGSLGDHEFDWVQVGHDFWLTRNGHGAGFWDGDHEKELGKELTKLAHSFREQVLYLGDDGKIHLG